MIEYLIIIANLAVLAFMVATLYKKSRSSALSNFFLPGLILKLSAGIVLGIIYRHYYDGGDTWQYFKEASRIAAIADESFWGYLKTLLTDAEASSSRFSNQPRAYFMSSVTSCFVILTNANYWLTSIYFSLFSFMGFWFLAQKLLSVCKNKFAIGISLLFFPSIVFWSSGISKESLAMISLTILAAYLIIFLFKLREIRWFEYVFIFLALVLLWKVKYYYAGVFLLTFGSGMAVYLLSRKIKAIEKGWDRLLLSFAGVFIIIAAVVSLSAYNFHLGRLPELIVKNYQAFTAKSSPEQMVIFDTLESNYSNIISNSPKALVSGLYRPFIGDGRGILSVISAVENLFLLFLTISSLFALPVTLKFREKILLISAVLFIAILAIFLTLSAPNFGTLVRYKVAFLPAFLLILTHSNPLIKRANRWLFEE